MLDQRGSIVCGAMLFVALSWGVGQPCRAEENAVATTDSTVVENASVVDGRKELQHGHVNNAIDFLSGTNAGVTIGSNANSEAMLTSVRIRGNSSLTGNNDPLVIIDGMSSDMRTLTSVYPGDIDKIEVLKDASQTAMYGSRGAAGVIVVTTKRAHAAAFRVGYSGDVGFAHVSKLLDMLSADAYRSVNERAGIPIYDGGASSDWQRSILRTGMVQNHNIACSGGNEQTQFRASLSFSHNNSVVQTIGNQNLTAKLDLTQKALGDKITIDLGMFGSVRENKYINNEQKLFYSAASFNPTIATGRTEAGTWNGYPEASQINNPQGLLDILNHQWNMHFSTHGNVKADITDYLRLSVFGSYSYAMGEEADFYPTYMESTGKIYRSADKYTTWLTNAALEYHNIWGEGRNTHNLSVNLLGEMQGKTTTGFYTTVNMLASNAYGYNNLAVGALRLWNGTGSGYEQQHLVSVMGNATYTALSRYTVSVTLRADGSSVVSGKNKWGIFPAASLSWDMKNEDWLRDVGTLSALKIHAGYGMSGNLGGMAAYNSLQLYKPTGVIDNDGVPQVVLGITQNSNENLSWEKKHTFDAGVDVGFWGNRVVLHGDYYYSLITDMLYNYTVSVPPFPYSTLLANMGRMMNQGIEGGIGIAAVQTKDWDFNINLNVTWQQNRLLRLDGWYGDQYLTAPQYRALAGLNGAGLHGGYSNVTYQIVGESLGVFYLPHSTGLVTQADGTMRYEIEDLDGNGTIDLSDGGDRQVCGQATPKVLLGSNFSVRYKQFDLSIQLNGAFGHKIYNGTALSYKNMGSLPYYNVLRDAEQLNINDMTVTDYWLERGDYVNIDYMTIGYTYEPKKQNVLKQLRVSLSVNNLATITGYSGLTPIINSTVINGSLGVDDKNTFPVHRTYSMALNIQF